MITNTATFVLLAERRVDGPGRAPRSISRPGRGAFRRAVLQLAKAAGFPLAWTPLSVSSTDVDPRPVHSSQG